MLFQAFPKFRARRGGRVAFGHHDDVDRREFRLVGTKGFPRLALDPVAANGGRRDLARDGETETRRADIIRGGEQREERVGRTETLAENASKRFRFQQALLAGKPEVCFRLKRRAYGQSLARPFARRALSTLRPPLVAMRARKPWVRLRRRLLGWYVLFMTACPYRLESSVLQKRAPGDSPARGRQEYGPSACLSTEKRVRRPVYNPIRGCG